MAKVFLSLDAETECLYYDEYPLEILFMVKRRNQKISTWIQPVTTFDGHKLNCRCDLELKPNQDCIVTYKNKMYDLNLVTNQWRNHSCGNFSILLEDDDMFINRYSKDEKQNSIQLTVDLETLGQTIKQARSKSNFTRDMLLLHMLTKNDDEDI